MQATAIWFWSQPGRGGSPGRGQPNKPATVAPSLSLAEAEAQTTPALRSVAEDLSVREVEEPVRNYLEYPAAVTTHPVKAATLAEGPSLGEARGDPVGAARRGATQMGKKTRPRHHRVRPATTWERIAPRSSVWPGALARPSPGSVCDGSGGRADEENSPRSTNEIPAAWAAIGRRPSYRLRRARRSHR